MGWTEPAIIWAAIIGESGTQKSPAMGKALWPVRELKDKALRQHDQETLGWNEPKEAIPARYLVEDTTVEALAPILCENWRGVLLVRDELSAWFASFDRYAKGNGGDAGRWLSMFRGEPLTVDRETGGTPTIYVPRASVSILGGIQPQAMIRVLGAEHRENGLLARLLLAHPPRQRKRWTEAVVDDNLDGCLRNMFDRLSKLQPDQTEGGHPNPVILPLTADGKSNFIEFYNDHAMEQGTMHGELAAAWSKLEAYAARLALLVHCIRDASDDPSLSDPRAVDVESVTAGVELLAWFKSETRRIYASLNGNEIIQRRSELVDLIRQKDGRICVRKLMQSSRRYRKKARKAEEALEDLRRVGCGDWEILSPGDRGGRPSKEFILREGLR